MSDELALTIDGVNVGDVISFPDQSILPMYARDRLFQVTRVDVESGKVSLLEYNPPTETR